MADWNANVGISQLYTTLLSLLAARDVDAVTLGKSAYTNPPDGAIAYDRGALKFKEWNLAGAAYVDIILAIAGGGTGASTAASARANLGLGSLATQNSGSVTITGGTVAADLTSSTNVPASALAGGPINQARLGSGSAGAGAKFLADDQTYKTIITSLTYGADQSGNFTPTLEMVYNLLGSHTVILPTVIGNGGKRVWFVNKGGSSWQFSANGAETILGLSAFTFDFGQYSSVMLVADANNGKWDVF